MDISTREDIDRLLARFYEKVREDATIGYIFNDIIKVNWEKHLPLIGDFWETLLLDTGKYYGNTMGVHYAINKKVKLEKEHFDRWIGLFNDTIDELFEGTVATMAKKKAGSIATLMQFKMQQENEAVKKFPGPGL
jgi:Truncated hemoglobins